jgi:hypothetical protein
MPPALYNYRTGSKYESKEHMISERKHRDNIGQKIKYWRKAYNYDLTASDYDTFSKYVPIIKDIHKIHKFICELDPMNVSSKDLDIYASNYKKIKSALPIQSYLKTLKKIGQSQHEEKPNKIIVRF